jgi:Domain of unknown function (DUF6468)
VSHVVALIIESLVAVLLVVTIGYCTVLNRRLKRLKADEFTLKATISELITATEIAERAIAGLKLTVRDCDQNLGERLRTAERFSADIERQLMAGEEVLHRLAKIVTATRPEPALEVVAAAAAIAPAAVAQAAHDPHAMVAAAQAFVERTKLRLGGRAA